MKRLFRRAEPTSRQDLERQAAQELRAASGLPQAALPTQDHPAGQGAKTDEEGEDGDSDQVAAESLPTIAPRRTRRAGRRKAGAGPD